MKQKKTFFVTIIALLVIISTQLVVSHEQEKNLELKVKQGFPQENSYVFECVSSGWSPDTYSWFYGDGSKQYNILNDNTWHTYLSNGYFSVSCSAKKEAFSLTAFLDVEVTSVKVDDPEDGGYSDPISSSSGFSNYRGDGGRREWVIDKAYFNDSLVCVSAHYRVREMHRVRNGVLNVFDHRYTTTMTKCLTPSEFVLNASSLSERWGVWGLVT